MMNRRRLMISTMLMSAVGAGVVCMVGFVGSAWAANEQCIVPPNCADLGYTSTTSCDNGVKCPWGEAWYCPPSPPEVCEIGSILYSDMTCYKDAQAGKTPIGVVVYVDGLGGGQAMALKSIGKYQWSTEYAQILNYSQITRYDSCGNTKKIVAFGNKEIYPAAWAAHEYSTEGTSAGDWCLPASYVCGKHDSNQADVIKKAFISVGGSAPVSAWTSSEQEYSRATSCQLTTSAGTIAKKLSEDVYPVFEFVQTFEGICKASFEYTCNGEKETGGIGEACGGKYTECSCATGYEWWNGKCVVPCETVGSILFSDKTCSMNLQDGKTPIGIVAYVDGSGGGQALALKSIGRYEWGGYGVTIPGIGFGNKWDAAADFNSCSNTETILAAGNKDTYPAAWAAHEYSTEGTIAGDWCLPAAGIFYSYFRNQAYLNQGFRKAGENDFSVGMTVWSSTPVGYNAYASFREDRDYWFKYYPKTDSYEVYPVIEF